MTINHAKVKDRLKAFWEANPFGKIETSMKKEGDSVIFKTQILADKSNEFSREATGHSYGSVGDEKSFEKLETISVGRALALLGYSTDGEIASVEEMEEFHEYQHQKREEKIEEITKKIKATKTIDELKKLWSSLNGEVQVELDEIKNSQKAKLDENKNISK